MRDVEFLKWLFVDNGRYEEKALEILGNTKNGLTKAIKSVI